MRPSRVEEPNEATRSSKTRPSVGVSGLLPQFRHKLGGGGVRNVYFSIALLEDISRQDAINIIMAVLSETETLELKKSTSELKEAVISIASMLNKHGKGILYFGVRNDGRALGQDVGEKTIRDVSQAIS
jgi:hypothetical protein